MPRLSDEKINEILSSVDIVDVISAYVPLTKKGKDYKGICPFHQDTKPSLSVSPKLQIYKCFACGAGGNAFTFLQKHLNISYMEAIQQVASLSGVEIPEISQVEHKREVDDTTKGFYEMHNRAEQLYTHLLHTTSGLKAYEYLQNRHIDDSIIDKFGIGYAAKNDYLVQSFEKLNYTHQNMALSGLIIESEYGYFDRYKDRIMFPIEDEYGQIVGFSGRIYQGEKDQAKYMNSPESPIFNKSKILYHYFKAKEATRKAGFVYLCEGFMDIIALTRVGKENAIALMGTALTSEHLAMIRKITNTVYICLDGDNAGKHAALRASKILTENHFKVSLILLPENKDPDEILEAYGPEGLKEALNKLITPVDFELDYLYSSSNMANYEDRKNFLQDACKVIVNIEDVIDQHYYIDRIATMANFGVENVEEYVRSLRFQKAVDPKLPEVTQSSAVRKKRYNKYQKAERELLYYMMQSKAVANVYEKKLGFMFEDDYRVIASYIVDYYRVHDSFAVSSFLLSIEDDRLIDIITELFENELPALENLKIIDDYIATIKKHAEILEIEDLKEQMASELDPIKKAELAMKIIDIQSKKEGYDGRK